MTRQLESYGEYLSSGVLKDVSLVAQELGFGRPVAVETELFEAYFVPNSDLINFGQTTQNRLDFVLKTIRHRWSHENGPLISFMHSFLMGNKEPWLEEVRLSALAHLNDSGQEVVTIFMGEETFVPGSQYFML